MLIFMFYYPDALQKFRIDIVCLGKTEMEFDMVGVDASIANALRRILLAEVSFCFIDPFHVYVNEVELEDKTITRSDV